MKDKQIEELSAEVERLTNELQKAQNSDEHNFTRWQRAEEQLAAAQKDAARLDFVVSNQAFVTTSKTDAGTLTYQLVTQDEDENFVVLSGGFEFYKSPREAIDSAMQRKEGE